MTITESQSASVDAPLGVVREVDGGTPRRPDAPLLLPQGIRSLHRRTVGRIALAAADILALGFAVVISRALFSGSAVDASGLSGSIDLATFGAFVPIWLVLGSFYGVYTHDDRRPDHCTTDELVDLFHLLTIGSVLVFALSPLVASEGVEPLRLASFWIAALVLVGLARATCRAILRRQRVFRERVAILGSGRLAQAAAEKLELANRRDLKLLGFFSSHSRDGNAAGSPVEIAGTPGALLRLVRAREVDRVVVAGGADGDGESLALLRFLDHLDVQVDVVSPWSEAVGPSAEIHDVRGLHVIGMPRARTTRSSARAKRAIDVVVSLTVLVLVLPLFVVIAALVRCTSRGSILYRGGRIGMNGVRFEQLKFRTMKIECCRGERYGGSDADSAFAELMQDPARRAEFERTRKLANDPRVTRVGRFLRRTSLDELPSLVNVLAGHVSLVGPRSVTVQEFAEQPTVDRSTGLIPYWELPGVRPGITGYAVINGRARLSYAERVRLDMLYAANRSIKLDLRIMAKTVRVLVSREGAE